MLKVQRILIILWMVVIFLFSAQPATQSSKLSDSLSYKIVSTANDFLKQGWTQAEVMERSEGLQYPLRKGAHMAEYAILAILWSIYFYTKGNKKTKIFGLAVLFTVLYACTDEFHQLFVPGRSGMITDVCIDGVGGIIGSLVVMLWITYFRNANFMKREGKQ